MNPCHRFLHIALSVCFVSANMGNCTNEPLTNEMPEHGFMMCGKRSTRIMAFTICCPLFGMSACMWRCQSHWPTGSVLIFEACCFQIASCSNPSGKLVSHGGFFVGPCSSARLIRRHDYGQCPAASLSQLRRPMLFADFMGWNACL